MGFATMNTINLKKIQELINIQFFPEGIHKIVNFEDPPKPTFERLSRYDALYYKGCPDKDKYCIGKHKSKTGRWM